MQETKRLADVAGTDRICPCLLAQQLMFLLAFLGKHHYSANSFPPSHTWLMAYSITTTDGRSRPYAVPRKQESFSSMLASYGTKALEGLPPSLSNTLGSFSFLSMGPGVPATFSAPPLPPRPRVQRIFEPILDEETQSKLDARRGEFTHVSKLRYR